MILNGRAFGVNVGQPRTGCPVQSTVVFALKPTKTNCNFRQSLGCKILGTAAVDAEKNDSSGKRGFP
jgi:hypothetical protein